MTLEGHTEQSMCQAVRQAIFHISRTNLIPESNRLLTSTLVSHTLCQESLEDSLPNRRAVVEEILRNLVCEYGLAQPTGRRQQRQHRYIFDVLFHLLRGEANKLDYPTRSYERYHAAGIRILAERFLEREWELNRESDADVKEARHRAEETRQWFTEHPGEIDFFALHEWQEAATIIADNDLWLEAGAHFSDALAVLEEAPTNQVILERRAQLAERLAHAHLNVGDLYESLRLYQWAAKVARVVADDLLWLEAIHSQGVVQTLLGHPSEATESLEMAAASALTDRLNPQERQGRILRDLLAANLDTWDTQQTNHIAQQAVTAWRNADNPQGILVTLETWARALLSRSDLAGARRRLDEATALLPESSSPIHRASLWITWISLVTAEGDWSMASAIAEQTRKICSMHGLVHQLQRLDNVLASGNGRFS